MLYISLINTLSMGTQIVPFYFYGRCPNKVVQQKNWPPSLKLLFVETLVGKLSDIGIIDPNPLLTYFSFHKQLPVVQSSSYTNDDPLSINQSLSMSTTHLGKGEL